MVFRDDPLVYEPGTSVLYTTYGYCLLGCVVEGAAGRPFADVLRDEVFAPAGMTATQVDDPRVLIPRRANGYVRNASGELAELGARRRDLQGPRRRPLRHGARRRALRPGAAVGPAPGPARRWSRC